MGKLEYIDQWLDKISENHGYLFYGSEGKKELKDDTQMSKWHWRIIH